MGSGIAKTIRDVYPRAYEFYRKMYDTSGLTLGQTIWVPVKPAIEGYPERWVINAITQEDYGRETGRLYASYDGIRKAIRQINAGNWMTEVSEDAAKHLGKAKRVGFPLIGAGLANGSWKIISEIIEEESTMFQPVVYLFDGKMPES